MKKRLSFLLAAVLVFLLVLTSCGGDPYKGNYEEVSEEQAKQYLDRFHDLEEVLESKNLKIVFSGVMTEAETGDKIDISGSSITDCSDPDNMKVYEEVSFKRTTEDGTYKLSVKAYTDSASGKTLAEVEASAPGLDDFSFKGQLKIDGLYAFRTLTESVSTEDFLFELEEVLEERIDGEEGVKVYADGDKIKLIYESTEDGDEAKAEVYAVISEENFQCKFISSGTIEGATFTEDAEIKLVSEKVKIPTSGYETEMSTLEFMNVLLSYMGDDE